MLAKTREGYANISRLFTLANSEDRRKPRLDPALMREYAGGGVLLTGGRGGPLAKLLSGGRREDARALLVDYLEWYGSGSVYVELQQNFLQGDTDRNRESARLAKRGRRSHRGNQRRPLPLAGEVQAPARPGRRRPQHHHRPGLALHQPQPPSAPEAAGADGAPLPGLPGGHRQHSLEIAGQCSFNLATDLGYTLPDPAVPEGYTADTYLRRLCMEAAMRRYGSISRRVEERLEEEFSLIARHSMAGFLLLYREIALIAQGIMEERGLAHPETPLEERPPGRGRGSSVAMLVGYLIGISHVDPLRWDLTLERFISEDTSLLPDIDLDFPRGLRDELIQRVHRRFGPDHAVLAGAIATYSAKGIIQDLGKALGLPKEDLRLLSKQIHSHDGADLREEMLGLPAFRERVDAPGWRDLLEMAPQLMHAPRSLGQHVGGMVLSHFPSPAWSRCGMAPCRAGTLWTGTRTASPTPISPR